MLEFYNLGFDIEKLDTLLALKKDKELKNVAINLSDDVIYQYLLSLGAKLLHDRKSKYGILDIAQVRFDEKKDDGSNNTVFLSSSCIGDVCSARGISPKEVDNYIENLVNNTLNSNFYKIEANEDDRKLVTISYTKMQNKEGELEWLLHKQFQIKMPNFNKACDIYDKFTECFDGGVLINEAFINLICEYIECDGNKISYNEFKEAFKDNLVLCYDFIAYFVDLVYGGDKKKV